MSVHDETASRERGRRGSVRHARSAARSTPQQRDGVLVLVPTTEPADRPDPLVRIAMAHDAMVEQLRAERDAGLEEVAFLREQLGSARAYHLHELEERCALLHAERKVLLRQLAILGERLRRYVRETPETDGELAPEGDADPAATR